MFKKLVPTAATLLVASALSLAGAAGSAAALGSRGTSNGPIPGDLSTLALTGSNEFGWIVMAIILLQFGVGVLAVRAALKRRRQGLHRAG